VGTSHVIQQINKHLYPAIKHILVTDVVPKSKTKNAKPASKSSKDSEIDDDPADEEGTRHKNCFQQRFYSCFFFRCQ
jgi:hypothetical protein